MLLLFIMLIFITLMLTYGLYLFIVFDNEEEEEEEEEEVEEEEENTGRHMGASPAAATAPAPAPTATGPTPAPAEALTNYAQIGQDITNGQASDLSGYSVSINGNGTIMAIGAPQHSTKTGCTRVYEYDSSESEWVQIGENITGMEPDCKSGYSVSINKSGNTLAIGAYGERVKSLGKYGKDIGSTRVYVYDDTNKIWLQKGEPIIGSIRYGSLGYSVSINGDGTIVAIGAIGGTPRTRVYEYKDDKWTQMGLDIEGDKNSLFGHSVSINSDGKTVAIGAPHHNTDGVGKSGVTKVFEYVSLEWVQKGSDVVPTMQGHDYCGSSVSINGNGTIMAVGSRGRGGYARVYEYQTNDWVQIGQDIRAKVHGDGTGDSVSINSAGTIMAVGAYSSDANGKDSGHTSLYKYDSSALKWVQIGDDLFPRIPGNDGSSAARQQSGYSVSINDDGSTVAIGNKNDYRNYELGGNNYELGRTIVYKNSAYTS